MGTDLFKRLAINYYSNYRYGNMNKIDSKLFTTKKFLGYEKEVRSEEIIFL